MVTIKEIAREAKVSPTTVSLILNNKSKERKISALTEQKVLGLSSQSPGRQSEKGRGTILLPHPGPLGGGHQGPYHAALLQGHRGYHRG